MFYDLCYFNDEETLEETKSSYDIGIKARCGRGPGGELCGYIYSKDGGVLFEIANNFCPSDELIVNHYQLVCSAGCAYSVRLGKQIFGCCMNNFLLDKDIAAGYNLGDSSYLASDELFTKCEGEKNNLGFCFWRSRWDTCTATSSSGVITWSGCYRYYGDGLKRQYLFIPYYVGDIL